MENSKEGPWGGTLGSAWDDGSYDGVREIVITYDSNCINSIQVVYDKDGQPIAGQKHGAYEGKNKLEIKLDPADDFFVSASGHYGPVSFPERDITVIKSLTLKTKKGSTLGPIGDDKGTAFNTETNGSIVGFFGRSGSVIDAIGFYFSEN